MQLFIYKHGFITFVQVAFALFCVKVWFLVLPFCLNRFGLVILRLIMLGLWGLVVLLCHFNWNIHLMNEHHYYSLLTCCLNNYSFYQIYSFYLYFFIDVFIFTFLHLLLIFLSLIVYSLILWCQFHLPKYLHIYYLHWK